MYMKCSMLIYISAKCLFVVCRSVKRVSNPAINDSLVTVLTGVHGNDCSHRKIVTYGLYVFSCTQNMAVNWCGTTKHLSLFVLVMSTGAKLNSNSILVNIMKYNVCCAVITYIMQKYSKIFQGDLTCHKDISLARKMCAVIYIGDLWNSLYAFLVNTQKKGFICLGIHRNVRRIIHHWSYRIVYIIIGYIIQDQTYLLDL